MEAICAQYGWTAAHGTKAQFAKQVVANFVKDVYQSHEGTKAADAARILKLNEIKQVEIT